MIEKGILGNDNIIWQTFSWHFLDEVLCEVGHLLVVGVLAPHGLGYHLNLTKSWRFHIYSIYEQVREDNFLNSFQILVLPVEREAPVGWRKHSTHQGSERTSSIWETLHRLSYHSPWSPNEHVLIRVVNSIEYCNRQMYTSGM